MSKASICVVWCVLAASLAFADDKTPKNGERKDAEVTSTISKEGKQSPCFGACMVNFRRELQVPFAYLDTIGARIHEARKSPDPVELAAMAQSLAVAEQVAEKKASVTSEQVMKEAVRLAKLRGDAQELKAVAMLVSDATTKDDLKQRASAAEELVGEESEKGKFIHGTLRVENHSHECLRIYVDGRYVGTVHEHRTGYFHVYAPNHENHLDAYCEHGGELVEHAHYHGHTHGTLNWHIHH